MKIKNFIATWDITDPYFPSLITLISVFDREVKLHSLGSSEPLNTRRKFDLGYLGTIEL